jgi:hypothetical protein
MKIIRNTFRFKVGDTVTTDYHPDKPCQIVAIHNCGHEKNLVNDEGFSLCMGRCPERWGCPGLIITDIEEDSERANCHGYKDEYKVYMVEKAKQEGA